MIEFDCCSCNVHVHHYGRTTIPASRMCSVCEWIHEHIPDPAERAAALGRHCPGSAVQEVYSGEPFPFDGRGANH